MRMLNEQEIELVSGGRGETRSWTFRSPPVTLVDADAAIQDLKGSVLSGSIGGGLGSGIPGALIGGLGGGIVAIYNFRTHTRRVTPTITIERVPSAPGESDSDS